MQTLNEVFFLYLLRISKGVVRDREEPEEEGRMIELAR